MSAAAKLETVLEPGRRPDIEKELTEKYHVKWRFVPDVTIHQFNIKESLHNQARFEPYDEATVEQYREAVERGDDFPALIVYRPGAARSRYVTIDGNHRMLAHDRAGKNMSVYEVDRDTDPRTIAMMTYSFNTRHGRPTSEKERITQAMFLTDNGASVDNAANAVNLAPSVLRKAIAAHKADLRADEVGLKRNEWEALSSTVRNRLLHVSTDEGFRAAAELAMHAQLTAPEVFDLAAQVNTTKSSAKQVAMVKTLRQGYLERIQGSLGGLLSESQAGGNRRGGMTPRARLGLSLSHLLVLDNPDVIAKAYVGDERKEAAERMRDASSRLTKIADALERRK